MEFRNHDRCRHGRGGRRQDHDRTSPGRRPGTDDPLLDDETIRNGSYEIEFSIGDYFRATSIPVDDPPFLDIVVIRFTISDDQSYHVPLLVSPWSYSSYRGS